ncbi:MAG: NEW3 domain-containing protein [Candidatus Faecivicinus sp.]
MKHMAHNSLLRALLLGLIVLSLTASAWAEPADEAARYIELSTKYPSMVVKAGDSLTFDLDVDNQSGASQDMELSIVEMPEGWEGSFSAGSKQVNVVHVKDGDANTDLDFAVDIPLEAEDGEYRIVLKAQGGSYSDEMTLRFTVSAEQMGESSFTVEYPSQEGDADTSFSFNATLINNTLSAQSYSFASSAPTGWQVSFMPSGESTKVAALEVEARTSQGLDVSVTPPENVEAGSYEIHLTATSASEKLSLDLEVVITGSYDVSLATPSGRLSFDAYANKEASVQLSITNNGNTELTNVNLTSSAPSGWSVRFENETIDLIEAGATVETTAYITPGEDAMSGDYVTKLTVKNSKTSDSTEFRVTVKTETKWGFTGIAVIVLLAAAIAVIMRRYGRR